MIAVALAFLGLFILVFARVPIGLAMLVSGFCGYFYFTGFNAALALVGQNFRDVGFSYSLSVIPMFVLMGNLVAQARLAQNLYDAANSFIGHFRGGLAMATIIACGGFAAICGSSVATAATMTKVSYGAMKQHGYADGLSTASIASGGTLGILIPPSVVMIIYGVSTETHIGKLFAAGMIPGIVGILGYMLAVRWTVSRDPEAGPAGSRAGWRDRFRSLLDVWGVLVLFGGIMGGIYGGLFTPTEAAGVGALGAAAFCVLRGLLTAEVLYRALSETARTTASLFFVIMGAYVFADFVSYSGSPDLIAAAVAGLDVPPFLVMVAILAVYILLGCVMDSIAMILLTVPVFFPIIVALGYDPVWFGVMVVMVVEIGLITPPIGMNVFIIGSMVPGVRMNAIFRGVVPFIFADILRLALLLAFPGIALFLPRLFFG